MITRREVKPNIQSAIQIAIHPEYQSQGLSSLHGSSHARDCKVQGFPKSGGTRQANQKSKYPLTSIDDYIQWTNDEGLPFDAWLRVHARLGARIIKPCHQAMVIRGTRPEWEKWTGLKFLQSGPYYIPGALRPMEMDLEKDEGVYIEPNVWMVHTIA